MNETNVVSSGASTPTSALVVGVGASRGLGAALARRFAAEGLRVVVAGRNAPKLEATVAEMQAAGLDAVGVVGDASVAADVRRFVDTAEALAPLALVAHNAGSNRPAPFLEVSEAAFSEHWREHCLGGFLVGQAALRAMLPRSRGTIVFTGASGSLRGKKNFAPFAAAKAGLRAVAQSIAREFGPQGIHVAHVIIDGGIEGDRLLSRFPDALEKRGVDGMLKIDAIAEAYWQIHRQQRSAWTHELDLRPWAESF